MSGASSGLVTGYATRRGTEAYAASVGVRCGRGHFSDYLNVHLKLSSLGIGTFPGAATDVVDEIYATNVERALLGGINVIDTAAHYRYGRSLAAVRAGLQRAFGAGVAREQIFIVAKGGFLVYPEGKPQDPEAWFDANIVARGLGTREDLAGEHLLAATYLLWQLEFSRAALGLETVDAFLVDQPELQVAAYGKEKAYQRLARCFAVLEDAVKAGKIGAYGISSFASMRVETDAPLFQSIPALQGLAEQAARAVWTDPGTRHHLRVAQLPFNPAMTEGFTRFSQATGQGNVASSLQAAHQLRVYVMASHVLGKGRFAHDDPLAVALPQFANPAQRALQFARSTPGIGTALVGVSAAAHLDDMLAVAGTAPMARDEYLKLYRRSD